MSKNENRQLDNAQRIKDGGKWRLVLKMGFWIGLWNYILLNLLEIKEQPWQELYFSKSGLMILLWSFLSGCVLGLLMWWMNERRIKKMEQGK